MNIHIYKRRTLEYIRDYQLEHGAAPSMREIMRALGMSSPSLAHRIVKALEAEGRVMGTPGKHRSIELVPLSGTIAIELPPLIYAEISVIAEYARVPIGAVCLEAICHGLKNVRCASRETSGGSNGQAEPGHRADQGRV